MIRAPVGEVNVALRMREEHAVVGGEGNGGVILPELHLGRDAPLAVALILQLMLEDPRSISQMVAEAPRYAIIKTRLDRPNAPRQPLVVVIDAPAHQRSLLRRWLTA